MSTLATTSSTELLTPEEAAERGREAAHLNPGGIPAPSPYTP